MTQRLALGVSYDGSRWHGWQSQADGCTVQDQLQTALSKFANQPITTHCAGRTDTGVHALGQVVHIDAPMNRSLQGWVRGVNALLPSSINVQWAQIVAPEFHARFTAQARSYEYWLWNHSVRPALYAQQVGWYHQTLDEVAMQVAAQHLLGEHDFSAFRSSECQAKSPIKHLQQLTITRHGHTLRIQCRANAFLHHMVRNIVGALIYVGCGRQPSDWLIDLLKQKDRGLAAPTFSPAGLYLVQVHYPSEYNIPLPVQHPFLSV